MIYFAWHIARGCSLTCRSVFSELWLLYYIGEYIPDSKVHLANMGPIWGRQDPGGPHVGPMNFVIWDVTLIAIIE